MYDVIGKVETFDEDFKYIVHTAGLGDIIPTSDIDIKRNAVPVAHTDSRTHKYFDLLTEEQKQDLFNMYRFVFELFGYTADEYF